MAQKAIIYRILIASPSDCKEERKLFREAIYSWNAANSLNSSAILEPVLWETHANPEFGKRPQAVINKQLLKNCDILIGSFWTRLGTHTGKAVSGTAEEIEEFRNDGKPVFLYFSSLPVVLDSIDQQQYTALLEYKKKIENEGLFFKYDSLEELREMFTRHLSSKISDIHNVEYADFNEEELEIDKAIKGIEEFRSNFNSFLRKLEIEWDLEKATYEKTYKIDDSRYILEQALENLVNFSSQIVSDSDQTVTNLLRSIAVEMKYLIARTERKDSSFDSDSYWNSGTENIDKLKNIDTELDKWIDELNQSNE